MNLLQGLEPFEKLVVGGGSKNFTGRFQRLYGGQKAFKSSALVQTLDLDLPSLTKLKQEFFSTSPWLFVKSLKTILIQIKTSSRLLQDYIRTNTGPDKD